jgi:hypothetical protein
MVGSRIMVFFYKKYIEKEQTAGPKMTMPCGNLTDILFVRALALILCKEHPPKLYKNESSLESDKNVLTVDYRIWRI